MSYPWVPNQIASRKPLSTSYKIVCRVPSQAYRGMLNRFENSHGINHRVAPTTSYIFDQKCYPNRGCLITGLPQEPTIDPKQSSGINPPPGSLGLGLPKPIMPVRRPENTRTLLQRRIRTARRAPSIWARCSAHPSIPEGFVAPPVEISSNLKA